MDKFEIVIEEKMINNFYYFNLMIHVVTSNKKSLLFLAITIALLSACSRNTATDVPSPVNTSPVDTLGTGWEKIAMPSLTYTDIFFINNTGFTVGGTNIFKSIDGGNTWQKIYQSASTLVNIAMGSESNIVFTSATNKILFTKDGGINFDSVTVVDVPNDAFFVNATTVYAVGNSFWKSTNAGSTWTKLYNFPASGYTSLHFLNDQNGWVVASGGAYKTINGGTTWQQKISGPDFNFNGATGSVYFIDANTGYISDGGHIGKTSNSGDSWTKIFNAGSGYQDIHFVSLTTGYFTDSKYIYKTTNGGTNWNKEVVLQGKTFIELHFTDATHGWACGSDGTILKYQN
jgi:photosystem II stability/assembly factor-like uncharacterized protein